MDDCHLCVARTSIRHLSIDHQLFHPSSVNGHLFLIRLTGGAGAIPSSHWARGKNTRWTGCQSVTHSHTHSLTSRCFFDSPIKPVFMLLVCGRKLRRSASCCRFWSSCCPFELALNDLCRPVWPLRDTGDRDRNTLSPFLMCQQAVLKANLFQANQTHLLPLATAWCHFTCQTTASSQPIRGLLGPTRAIYLQQTRRVTKSKDELGA